MNSLAASGTKEVGKTYLKIKFLHIHNVRSLIVNVVIFVNCSNSFFYAIQIWVWWLVSVRCSRVGKWGCFNFINNFKCLLNSPCPNVSSCVTFKHWDKSKKKGLTQCFAFTIETRWHFQRQHWGKSGCNQEAQLDWCARWGGRGGSRNFLSLLETEKKLQHKPAHRQGKWFSRPVLPEERAACRPHQNNDLKWKKICKNHKWGCNFNSMISAGPEPPWSTSDSECQAGYRWSQTSGLQRPGGENTEGPVFLSFGPARPGLALTGQA